MTDLDALTARWQRRNPNARFVWLFSEWEVGYVPAGTMVHSRLRLAIANQRFVHSLRAALRPILRRTKT